VLRISGIDEVLEIGKEWQDQRCWTGGLEAEHRSISTLNAVMVLLKPLF
jgi:hypothetical protein